MTELKKQTKTALKGGEFMDWYKNLSETEQNEYHNKLTYIQDHKRDHVDKKHLLKGQYMPFKPGEGRPAFNISETQIRYAMENSKSCAEAARPKPLSTPV